MNTIHSFARNLVASAVALVIVGLATHATAQVPVVAPGNPEVTAKVVFVKGKARYSTDNKNWKMVSKGDILKPGTVIQTADNSTVDLVLGSDKDATGPQRVVHNSANNPPSGGGDSDKNSQNVVRIFEGTVLGIDKLTLENTGADEVSETQLDLRAGSIMGNVKKLSAASKYEVKIPNGVAGIRGTTYMIAASGVVNVLTGSVVVAVVDKDGSVVTRVISAGFRYNPAADRIEAIPGPQYQKLLKEYDSMNYPPQTPPTSYPKDHTIVYVSPKGGDNNDQGENNNNQGGNNNQQ